MLLQHLPERAGLVEHPGIHGGDQGVARNEVHLQRQDAEEQVAVGRVVGHGASSYSDTGKERLASIRLKITLPAAETTGQDGLIANAIFLSSCHISSYIS